MKKSILPILFVSFFLISKSVFAQTGNFYITNYSPASYGASDQNRGVTQDKFGRVFAANLNGVLLFDGGFWKIIALRNESIAFSLEKSKKGKIYVGGSGEFGELEQLPDGRYVYNSISKKLTGKDLNFKAVRNIRLIDEDVFFMADELIFRYSNGKIKVFNPSDSSNQGFHRVYTVGKHLFIREFVTGLRVIQGDKILNVKNADVFKDNRIDFILKGNGNDYYIGSRTAGLFKMQYNPIDPSSSVITELNLPVEKWMLDNELYCGEKFSDSTFLLGSLKGGLLIADKDFNIQKTINSSNGLIDDAVNHIYIDYNNNVWLSLNTGLAMVELNTPITRWAKAEGVIGTIESSTKFQNRLYIGTDKGLLILNEKENKFFPTSIKEQVFDLSIKKDELLVGTSGGVYSLSAIGQVNYLLEESAYKLAHDSSETSKLYIGGEFGLVIGKFQPDGKIAVWKSFSDWEGQGVRSIVFTKTGKAICGTSLGKVYVVDRQTGKLENAVGVKEGLPDLNENFVFKFNDRVLVGTSKGIYEFSDNTYSKVIRPKELNPFLLPDQQVPRASQIENAIWIQSTVTNENKVKWDELNSLVPGKNGMNQDHKMLQRIKESNAKHFYFDNKTVFISTNNGYFSYDLSAKPKHAKIYTFVSKLKFLKDTVALLQNYHPGMKAPEIEIPFNKNGIELEFGSSDYHSQTDLKFSFYLEGFDKGFIPFQKAKEFSYTNLHEGSYTLHVKSMNVFGEIGEEVSVPFIVLPPWYRTVWAYLIYGALVIVLIWVIVKFNTRRLKEQNIRLENIIHERTKTIVDQKAEIEHKNQEITDSINYAKRIQEAILPPIKDILSTWEKSFVFYQPKDIVSGDFYWFNKINENEFLIAVADCTGHGVPGGFMSMICSDKLNDAAKQSSNPAEILFSANNNIKRTLRQGQTEGGSKDGMEIALLHVNTKTRKVRFAGANRPLWILKLNTQDIEEIKPTKASIASFTEYDFEYALHEFQLDEGDLLYLTSDGYPDQFGGAEGKKFMSKNMKKLITEHKNKNMFEQGKEIAKHITEWMKGYEQVDDLLVIGIKM